MLKVWFVPATLIYMYQQVVCYVYAAFVLVTGYPQSASEVFPWDMSWSKLVPIFVTWQVMVISTHLAHHRYFSHRGFKTSRLLQLLLAVLGTTSDRGPLWWSSTHRAHHAHCETEKDRHSPRWHGFWYAHIGWTMHSSNIAIEFDKVKELSVWYPELMVVDALYPLCWVGSGYVWLLVWRTIWDPTYTIREYFAMHYLGSVSLCLHSKFLTNSVCHLDEVDADDHASSANKQNGSENTERRAGDDGDEKDLCRPLDVWWVGIFNGGEGFHKNHHSVPRSAKHGFRRWYQVDTTFIVIQALEKVGLIWDVET